jgi:hypothetical protein
MAGGFDPAEGPRIGIVGSRKALIAASNSSTLQCTLRLIRRSVSRAKNRWIWFNQELLVG